MKKHKFLLIRKMVTLGLISCGCSGLTAQQAKPELASLSHDAELTIDRVSEEPDSFPLPSTLRWSALGDGIAWMRPAQVPQGNARLSLMEIWGMSPTSLPNVDRPAVRLLASANTITGALRGSSVSKPRRLEEDNPLAADPDKLLDFAWSSDGASLLLFGPRSIATLNLASGQTRTLLSVTDPFSDASLSPNGESIAFVRNHSLYCMDSHGGVPRLIAEPPKAGILEGEPDWAYRNELQLPRAYAWSPDSSQIAWLETDDRNVAEYSLRASNGAERRIAYPKPGGALPIVQIFVASLKGSNAVAIHLGSTADFYIPRIHWTLDSRHLAVERLNRRQQALDLYIADTVTGRTHLLLSETDRYWINLCNDLRFMHDGSFLWSSERTGFRHLYHYDAHGKQIAQLTHGNWEVTSLDAFGGDNEDEANPRIYFTATEASPTERQLYSVRLDGTEFRQLTHAHGTHDVRFAPGAMQFADIYSTFLTPPQVLILNTDAITSSESTQPPTPAPLSPLQPVEFMPFTLHLGDKTSAFMIKPPRFDPSQKYPVIVYLAGGPGEQAVRDAWQGAAGLWLQLMAKNGYVIFALDNHGAAGHGHIFEEPIHLRLGAQELVDQRDGLNYLRSLPYVDPRRIGVWGWGYGGYLAASAMLDRPIAYRAGFAGAPVIDWRLYDAVFAERYLDDPVVHANGWRTSSALGDGGPRSFKGALLVAQGTDDEFVHLNNLFTLQAALVNAGKSADYLLLPDRSHSIDDPPARKLLFTRMTEFFLKNL